MAVADIKTGFKAVFFNVHMSIQWRFCLARCRSRTTARQTEAPLDRHMDVKKNRLKAGFNICYRHNDTAYLLPISSLMLMAIIDADRVLGFGKKQPAFNKNACHVKQQSQPNAHG